MFDLALEAKFLLWIASFILQNHCFNISGSGSHRRHESEEKNSQP